MEKITFEDSGKIIRVGDCLETNTIRSWLSASGTLPKSIITSEEALKNLRNKYPLILKDFPTLRIKVINKDNLYYWHYASNEEIQFDNLFKIVDSKILDEVPIPNKSIESLLWRVEISQIENKTKIKVSASHSIIDGRGIFDLLDIFTLCALNKEFNEKLNNYKNQPVLYEYGKKDWFTKEFLMKDLINPYEKVNLSTTILNPPIETPSYVINHQWNVDYPPILKFCKKHNVSPQAILMAIQNEAIRIFNKGKYDDIPIGVQFAIDCRNSIYATETFKRSLFFTYSGISVSYLHPEKDVLENIKKSALILKDSSMVNQSCESVYFIANMRNEKTGKMINTTKFPNPNCYIFASHIGLVGVGLDDIQFRMYSFVYKNMYWPNLYGYHNKETFSFVFEIPYNTPEEYLKSVKNTSLKYYDFIVNNIKEE